MSNSRAGLIRGFTNLRLTYIFIFGYVVVNYIFAYVLLKVFSPQMSIFLTSPLNLFEVLTSSYSSIYQGLENNFIFVALIIAASELYARNTIRPSWWHLSVDAVFGLAFVTSYVESALSWWVTGRPTGGTSIVAFSMILFLFAISFADRGNYIRKHYPGDIRSQLRLAGWLSAVIFTAVFAISYVYGNPSYEAHLAGGAVFIVLSIAYAFLHKRQSPRTNTGASRLVY